MENGHAKHKKPASASAASSATGGAAAADQPPRVVSHLESRAVRDGEAVTLACRIIGAARFDVVWLHNNKEIKPSKDFQYTNEANIYKLQVAEIFPEDAGTYTCEAFNDAGESFSTCTINVLVPGDEPRQPVFRTYPASATLTVGERATFVCETEEELLQLNWLKDGRQIEESGVNGGARYLFTKDGQRYQLEIVGCQVGDVGQYQAKAIGKMGEQLAAFSVNVCAN